MPEIERSDRRVPVRARRVVETVDTGGSSAEQQQPFITFLQTVWQRRLFVIACLVLSITIGVVYLFNATKLYGGTSTLYVQRSLPKIVEEQMSTNGQGTAYLFTQCQVIQSTAILSAAAQSPEASVTKSLQGASNPVGLLKSFVTALPDKQGDLINVSATTMYPEDSAVIANAVTQAYIDYLGSQHKNTSVEVIKILQKEMDRREKELESARSQMLELRKNNPTLAFDNLKDSIANSQLEGKISGYSAAQTRLMDLETAAAEAKDQKDPSAVRLILAQYQIPFDTSVGDNGPVANEYAAAVRAIRNLQDRLGPEHRTMVAEQRDLNDLQQQLAATSDRALAAYKAAIDTAITAAKAKSDQFQKLIDDSQKNAVDSNVKQAQYSQLAQEVERTEHSLDTLDSRMKEIGIGEDAGAMSVSVLESAKPSYMPVSPKQSKVLGLSLVAGLLAGFGGALLMNALDQKLYTADEIVAALDLPLLGMIPRMVGRTSLVDRAQEVHLRPRSNITEAYRSLRTAIVFSNAELGALKTILCTSPTMSEGKSTTTSNLAIAFAHANRRVLLIDADCRRPAQAKLFKLKDGPGLTTLLAGQATIADVIQSTSIENLQIMPSGPLPANPVELLDSPAFTNMLAELVKQYDHILIDSPPIIPVTDARILSAACDATVLTVRTARSTKRLAVSARDTIIAMGGNLIGIIANDVSRGLHYYQYNGYRLKESTKSERRNGADKKPSSPIVARALAATASDGESTEHNA